MPTRVAMAVVALVAWGHVSAATAQVKRPPPPPPRANPKRPNKTPLNPAKELERFQKMSPEQREKEMAKLPPAQRLRMQRLYDRFENMPPAQREQALKRLEALHNLSPARRQAVTGELQNLRSLPPAQRRARLESDEIQQNFTPEERDLLNASVRPRQAPANVHD